MLAKRLLLASGFTAALLACGASAPDSSEPTTPPDDISDDLSDSESPEPVAEAPTKIAYEPTAAEPPPPGASTVSRVDLDTVLDAGPGAFLGRLRVRPTFRGNAFAGWELLGFTAAGASLEASGLQAGDVIARVNDHSVERPEQLQELWKALRAAEAIEVAGTRAGTPLKLRFEVVRDIVAP